MLCAAEIHPSAAAELLLVVEAGNTTTSLLVFQGTQLLDARKVLSIKSFLGTSQNAVLSQIWVAMCSYLLLSYIKFQTKYSYSLQVLTRMIASVLMEQRLLIDILSLDERSLQKVRDPVAQPSLF